MDVYEQDFCQSKSRFPDAISAVVGEVIGAFYYSHRRLEVTTETQTVGWLGLEPRTNA
jgi:hypothetical protein